MNTFLKDNGEPDLGKLIQTYKRCAPTVNGGTNWLENVRFCRWSPQWADGRKYDVSNDPNGCAKPFPGASDCRPMTVDGIINEKVGLLTEAFWRALTRPGASGEESGEFAVKLVDHLIWKVLYDDLVREVELSAQYCLGLGWYMLATRWKREIGLKHHAITMDEINQVAVVAYQALQKDAEHQSLEQSAPAGARLPAVPRLTVEQKTQLQGVAQLPAMILDPTLEAFAVDWLKNWYDDYVRQQLPESIQERAPKTTDNVARTVVRELRTKGKSKIALPYLCKDEPSVAALRPWDEVFLPPELTGTQELVFQRELVSEAELESRRITEDYDEDWIKEAVKLKGQVTATQFPMSTDRGGNALARLSGSQPVMTTQPDGVGNQETGLIEIVHAVYRDLDEYGVPGVFMTTFHTQIEKDKTGNQLLASHGLAEDVDGDLPYTAGANEHWSRSLTSSRSVPEIACSDQNLLKGTLDAIMDRTSITVLPPVNVYDSPTGTKYRFGPAEINYVRANREPKFMDMPSGQGMVDGVKMHDMIRKKIDNYFGLLSEDVPITRVQASQSSDVRRFLLTWSKAIAQLLMMCVKNMKDADFAKITGAEEGWLDAHRGADRPLYASLYFDVRELNPELFIEQAKAMNTLVLPVDTMNVVSRSNWPRVMARGIFGPAIAKELLLPTGDASQGIYDRVKAQVVGIFQGQEATMIEKKDPTATFQLEQAVNIISKNPMYLMVLNDEALQELLGAQAPMVLQQMQMNGIERAPNDQISGLVVQWLENLKFWGVKQPQAAQEGRIGTAATA